MPTPAPVRTASFKRKGFNNVELEKWKRRTGVLQILKVSATDTRIRVTYR